MKTKFKDFLLYSLAIIGAISLLISASNYNDDIDDVVDSLENIRSELSGIESELSGIQSQLGSGIYVYE